VVGTPAVGGAGAATTPAATPVSAAPKLPVTVTDQRGTKVTITDIGRIIPLSGDVAEIVWALGFGGNVVATDTSAIYPPETRQTPRIGFYRTVSAEGILTHRPTVILASENAGPPEALEQLRGAGVPVVIIPAGTDLAAPAQKIRAVGAALGVPEAGEQLAAQTQREIDEAKALAAKATTRPRVMFLNMRGTTVQQISGTNAPAHALIAAAGGIDAGAEAGIVGYKAITAEAVAAGQPDVFLMFSGGLTSINGVEGLLQMPGIAQTPAGQAKRVLAYEDQYLLGFGPRTGQALRELTLDLHPELK
jgi:iron complex transport system substrate-binding protein